MVQFYNEFTLIIIQAIDIFYKLALIIALFYATKALRIYILNNEKKRL